jgi:hypothetical protein
VSTSFAQNRRELPAPRGLPLLCLHGYFTILPYSTEIAGVFSGRVCKNSLSRFFYRHFPDWICFKQGLTIFGSRHSFELLDAPVIDF